MYRPASSSLFRFNFQPFGSDTEKKVGLAAQFGAANPNRLPSLFSQQPPVKQQRRSSSAGAAPRPSFSAPVSTRQHHTPH
jgi:hypothetical protein